MNINLPSRSTALLNQGGFLYGAYNVSQKATFSDGTAWLVCFLCVRNVCGEYANKKVVIKVKVMSLICEKTVIPVPQIKA
jgi:hypothetical protein